MRYAVRLVAILGSLVVGAPLPAQAQQPVVLVVPRQVEQAARATADASVLTAFDTTRVPIDATTRRIVYTGTVPISGASAGEVYERARWWFATTFRCDLPAPWLDTHPDKRMRLEVCYKHPVTTHLLGWRIRQSFPVYSTMLLCFQDGQCRYEITNLYTEVSTEGGPFRTEVEVWYDRGRCPTSRPKARAAAVRSFLAFDTAAHELIASLQQGMAQPTGAQVDQ
jgi:hypothetical protein